MDGKKILSIVQVYRDLCEARSASKATFPSEQYVNSRDEVVAHCHGMLDQIEEFVQQGRTEKAFRWLGFIQGCLWSQRLSTLADLKNDNRPDPAS